MAATLKAQVKRITSDLERVQREYTEAREAHTKAQEQARSAKARMQAAQAASEALTAKIATETPELAALVQALAGAPERPRTRSRSTTRKLDAPPVPEGVDAKGWTRGCEFAAKGKALSDNPFTAAARREAFVQAYNAMQALASTGA